MALVDRRPFFGLGAQGRTCTASAKDKEFYEFGVQNFIDKHFQPAYDAGYRRFIYWLPAGGYTDIVNEGQCLDGLVKSQSYVSSSIQALNWISPDGNGAVPADASGYPFTDGETNFGFTSLPYQVGNSVGPCAPGNEACYPEGDIDPGVNPNRINYYDDILSSNGALQRWLNGLNDPTIEFSFYVGYRTNVDQNPLINFIKEGANKPAMGPLNPRVITPNLQFEKSDGSFDTFREYVDRNFAPLIVASRAPNGYKKKIYVDNSSPSAITDRIQDQSDPTGGSRYTLREFTAYMKSEYNAEVIGEAIPTTGGSFPTNPDYSFIGDGALALYQFLEGFASDTTNGRDQGTWYFPKEYSNLLCAFATNGGWFWDTRFEGGYEGVAQAFRQKIDQGYVPGGMAQFGILPSGQGIANGVALNLMSYLQGELDGIPYEDNDGNTKYPYLNLP